MNVTFFRNEKNMAYEFYIKQPMQMVEMKLIKIIHNNPYLINTLYRSINQPLIRKNSNFPFT